MLCPSSIAAGPQNIMGTPIIKRGRFATILLVMCVAVLEDSMT